MRGKWAERLLAHFAPFAEHIAYMQDILGEDFRKEALDLLGDSRFRTLRQHLPGLRESPQERLHRDSMAGTTCPLSPQPARRGGGHPVQVAAGVEHPQVVLKDFGLLKIDELHRLKSKKSSLEETVTRPQRKAVVPSKEVIWALEEGAGYHCLGATGPGAQEAPGKSRHEVLDAFILGFARFQLVAALASMTSSTFTPRTLSTPVTLWS